MDIDIHPDMLEVLLQETDLIIYQVEVGKRQIRWFGAIERLTGFPADTLKSWKADQWFSQIHPQDRSRVKETIQSAREDQIPYHLEYRFKKSSADYIWLEDMGLFHIKGEDNARIIGTIRDISRRKTCETESQQYYSKLEEMVTNRTAELQEINNRPSPFSRA